MFMAGTGFRKLMTLRGHAAGDCAEDGTLAALLGEHDHPHLGRFRVCGRIQAEGNRAFGEVLHASNPLQGPDDTCMPEMMAAIFPATNIGRVRRIDEGGIEVTFCLSRRGRDGHSCGDLMAVNDRLRYSQRELGGLLGVLNSANRMRRVVADELIGAIDDHLRRVDAVDVKASAVLALPVGVLMRGEAVVPAEVVPVVNVLAQNDDLGSCDGLALVKLGQQSIGRRTARTTFRREKFHENRRAVRLRGLGAADSRCDDKDSRQGGD
jgi:hypothetical protein